MRQATIGGQVCGVGLDWRLAASRDEIRAGMEEGGHERGVVLKFGKRIAGVGFADGETRNPPPSAAAMLALQHPDAAVCAVEWAETEAGRQHWMAAASGGAVVSGTDALFDDPALLRRHIEELVQDFGCRVTGGASLEFGGDGESALAAARPGIRAAAAIRPLKAGTGPAKILLLLALSGGIAWLGWTLLKPDAPAPAAMPAIDRDAELRRQAVAERNRLLSQDLSGLGALRLARAARAAAKPLERSVAGWRLSLKRCEAAGSCTFTWQAMGAGSTPAGLALALGVGREQAISDLRAETVSVTGSLGAAGGPVAADEGTRLEGRVQPLVDRCRRYNGGGGSCALGAAQPAAVANAQLLPPALRYRRGTLALSGPLGGAEALLPLFDGGELAPWVRADRFDIDYEKLEFRLEAHYVTP